MVDTDLSGTTLDGRYRLVSLLGSGGMGQIYKGTHVALERRVAIKVLPSHLSEDQRFRARFAREARSAARITHRNVVQITDFGESLDGPVYFVMEFLDGRDLGALLREGRRLPWPRIRHLLLQAVSALKAAHAHGIIHRDIKPGNCFLIDLPHEGLTDVVKLLDFGIAKVLTELEGEGGTMIKPITATGEIMGTASYMAPEQARCEQMDARSDVYSLGVMAYEMLTGRVPFVGVNPFHVVTRHLYDRPEALHRLVPDILPEVEAMVLRALEKEPADRFQSMVELESAILTIGDEGVDLAQTRVFSTLGLARWHERRAPASGKPDGPTVVLREPEDSFEDAETPDPLHLPRLGKPYPLQAATAHEPFVPAFADDDDPPVAARIVEPAEERSIPIQVVLDRPRPLAEATPMSAEEATVNVSTFASSNVIVMKMAAEPYESSAVRLAVASDVSPSSAFPLIAESERSRSMVSRRSRSWGWSLLLGLVLLLSCGAAIATLALPEQQEGRAASVTASIATPEHSEPLLTPIVVDVPEAPAIDTAHLKAPVLEAVQTPKLDRSQANEPIVNEAEPSTSAPRVEPMEPIAAHDGDSPKPTANSVETNTASARPATRPPKSKPHETEQCKYERRRAHDSADVNDYGQVIELAAPGPCWPPSMRLERVRLYQDALSNTKRFGDCVKAGTGINAPDIVKATLHCQRKLGEARR